MGLKQLQLLETFLKRQLGGSLVPSGSFCCLEHGFVSRAPFQTMTTWDPRLYSRGGRAECWKQLDPRKSCQPIVGLSTPVTYTRGRNKLLPCLRYYFMTFCCLQLNQSLLTQAYLLISECVTQHSLQIKNIYLNHIYVTTISPSFSLIFILIYGAFSQRIFMFFRSGLEMLRTKIIQVIFVLSTLSIQQPV